MSIIKLAPAIQCYPWGGNTLQSKFGWNSEDVIAEGWLLSDQEGNESEVVTGPYAGTLFSAYLEKNPQSVGTLGKDNARFPVSVKMIDNQQPSAASAYPDESREAIFYVVEAGKDAVIHYGLEKDMSQDELQKALTEGTLLDQLKKVPVKAGDVFLMKAGIAYAIGAGIQILDVQQENELKEFKPEEIVESIKLSPVSQDHNVSEWVTMGEAQTALIGKCGGFEESLVELHGSLDIKAGDESFEALVFLDGNAVISQDGDTLHANPGDAFYIPAGSSTVNLAGNATFVQIHLV